ncbi:cell wall glucanase-like protein [Phialemonium atrogriseum]|uniref:Crh-like protein n=1 Tax=Phialemonium atrogriseum TaxID=1093897 RepID=A0AAJ0FLV1_9PEZI|nr:cell wall glucanase-like protein [Phialemonium atrogriseum]KAK1767728.1 cell wall glucanase-like protein [Phialemonium atrogriseum]
MFSRLISATAVALAATSLVSAQTSSLCNPVKGDKCPADKAVAPTAEVDFTKGASDFFTLADGTTLTYDAQNGAHFKISSDSNAPTITSKQYIFFGKVDVWLKASPGNGIVTSLVLQSDDLDEIDWEWLGGDSAQVQTNYFSKGDDSTYDRGGFSPVSNPQNEWHKYTIDWTNSSLTWLIDDAVVRVLNYADAKGGSTYPQTPMQIKLGTWVAGRKDAAPGTVEWAGGYPNYANGPFIGYYKQVSIINYSNGVKGASEYVYGDSSGTFGSIIVKTGGSTDVDPSPSSSRTSSSTSKTSTSSKTSHSPSASATVSSNSTATAGDSSSTVSGTGPTATGATTTPSTTPTTVPTNAAGNVAVTLGNVAALGAAMFLGSLAL